MWRTALRPLLCICSENQCNMTEAHDGHKRAQTQRERREKLSVSNLS